MDQLFTDLTTARLCQCFKMGLRLPHAYSPHCFNLSSRQQQNHSTSLLPPAAMLIVLFIAAAFSNAFSVPVASPVDALDPLSLTILGRDIPLPECINPAGYRTMQQIILSCLVTIFACTWVSLHPNVPHPDNSGWENFSMRLRTVFWAIIGPEFVTIWAFRQRIGAAEHAEDYNKKFSLKPRARSKFKCLMDWFRGPDKGTAPDRSWGLTHGFLLEMHGLRRFRNGQPFTSTSSDLIEYASDVSNPIYISEDEINDKSKGDFFTKLIVVIQTTWFIVQCVARWVQRLHVTELEIVTLAFAILNIITYILWWNKPQNMRVAIAIHDGRNDSGPTLAEQNAVTRRRDLSEQETSRLSSDDHSSGREALSVNHSDVSDKRPLLDNQLPCQPSMVPLAFIRSSQRHSLSSPPLLLDFCSEDKPTPSMGYDFDQERRVAVALGLIGVLFGGVHLFPIWLSSFSTSVEKYLWIACTIVILVEPVVLSLGDTVSSFASKLPDLLEKAVDYFLLHPIWFIGIPLYAPARLTLLVLAFTNLRTVPPSTFVNVEWTSFVPHV
ncbi:hypothetical protein NP233_g4404 [Leucocoprinus birnbaumii]|uniref:Uncharacterized protein n=1 Tax=Leucocoprinus birnbaumii TaxID=56174 RepID=A0AAD5VW53_9AGAR|nr:hypothetical protein NP233_g4404 [Leucocoprinus birnbaumii]